MEFPSWVSRKKPPEEYRGRGVSHSSFVPQPSQYARDNSPPPNPVLTQVDFDEAAKHVEKAGARQLAFAMQVDAYCKEIAQDFRIKGAVVADEMRRSLEMSQKVAEGARNLSKFVYEDSEEPTEALKPVAGRKPPAELADEPMEPVGEKEAPLEAPSIREETSQDGGHPQPTTPRAKFPD
jgi:hypothetical protein